MDRIEAFLGKKIDAVNPASIINASDIAMIAEYEPLWCEITDASMLVPVYLRRSRRRKLIMMPGGGLTSYVRYDIL